MKLQGPLALPKAVDPATRRAEQDKQLRQAAEMYEQHFLREMVKAMRETVHEDGGLIQTNFAEKIFREQLDGQHVEGWTKRGGVGLADIIYKSVKEKYMPDVPPGGFMVPKGPLPLNPRAPLPLNPKAQEGSPYMMLEKANSKKVDTSWLFQGPSGLAADERLVTAPFGGEISHAFSDENGRQMIRIKHPAGLESSLYFAGQTERQLVGNTVAPGQKLGQLSAESPQLTWRLLRT